MSHRIQSSILLSVQYKFYILLSDVYQELL